MKVSIGRPDALRLALFGGLLLHKVVWEVLRLRDQAAAPVPGPVNDRTDIDTAQPVMKEVAKKAKGAILLGLLGQTLFITAFPMSAQPDRIRAVGGLLFLAGLATAVAGRVALGRSWSNIEDATVKADHTLVSQGVYRFIRHPIYTGDSLLLIGLQMALNSWLALAMLAPLAIFARRAIAEEARLAQAIPDYEDYRRRTKRFVPFIY
jgi:protein-S-isoprenylcysteine O-methyltransferase Ste14